MLSELPMSISSPISGERINLRLVSIEDAEFILRLRTNPLLNRYISETDSSVEMQKSWIGAYKEREAKLEELYFIVESKDHTPVGTVRIYDINRKNSECTWGSFILDATRPEQSSMEVMALSVGIVFNQLKLSKIYLDVRKENKKAIHLYEKFGFKKVREDIRDYYYEMENDLNANDI